MRYALRTAGLATAMTMITLTAGLAPVAGTARAGGRLPAPLGAHRIQHVIEIMLENHTYANLFPVHVTAARQATDAPGARERGRRAGRHLQQPGRGVPGDGLPPGQGVPDGPVHPAALRLLGGHQVRRAVRPGPALPGQEIRVRDPELPARDRAHPAQRDDGAERDRARLVLQPPRPAPDPVVLDLRRADPVLRTPGRSTSGCRPGCTPAGPGTSWCPRRSGRTSPRPASSSPT